MIRDSHAFLFAFSLRHLEGDVPEWSGPISKAERISGSAGDGAGNARATSLAVYQLPVPNRSVPAQRGAIVRIMLVMDLFAEQEQAALRRVRHLPAASNV